MPPLQPENVRDLYQRLAELQEVQDDLPPEAMRRRVGAIVGGLVQLVREDPDDFASQCREILPLTDLDLALTYTHTLLQGRSEQP